MRDGHFVSIFFRLYFHYCLSSVHNCDDHSHLQNSNSHSIIDQKCKRLSHIKKKSKLFLMLNRFNLKLLTGAHDSFWLINQFLLTATEMQHFLLYFGLPLLKGVLDGDHFHHLALLTTGLWIFLKNEISREELAFAGEIMSSFCRLMEPLFGNNLSSYN